MGLRSWLFGGDATDGMPTGPQHGAQAGQYIQGQLGGVQDRQAPQFNSAQAVQSRADQTFLANQLRAQMTGQQAGAGELAVNRQVGQAQAAQEAQAQMARGGNAALAGRMAARNTADLGVTGAGMAQQAQMQDQTNAQNQLAGVLNGMRGQDIAIGQGNQNAALTQTGMNQQYGLGLLGQQLGYDQAALQQDALRRQIALGDKGMFPQLLAAGGQIGAAAASDERLKTDIVDADEDIDAMLDELQPKRYRYKNEKHGKGPRVGIMAQDMERSRAGRDVVRESEDGKMLDVNAALSLALASVARLNARLRKLEAANEA